ncbi:chaperone protein TorD [Slackia heliotrinireducens]|uniref:Uncharacterized component of anaerobic dehydrogenase n=1 Tax=Slackia heliotrinireducens (strain ATCC 29202 / DSM 20476 / NCTC 11029 / RHS 1) TaxID=471855 RepID=C7N1L5_SLAHD|nr:molecular chaperone TorD family protein [Slackia heliotrinireducens]ACV21307.1 uncharacterized component of anaerobic dehydrogenase [Slackia heliotrinireducens DSM 20476]VEG98742.1 chaperone protein TorD [Slackia heliotrinireducens]
MSPDAFFIVSKLFSYPDQALARELVEGNGLNELAEALRICATGPANLDDADGFETRNGSFEELEQAVHAFRQHFGPMSVDEALHDMRIEHTNALAGMPKPMVQPYESIFRGEAEGRRVLIMVDDIAAQVRAAYKSAGVVQVNGSEPADHVSTELEFLGLLADRDDPTFRSFAEDHVLSWMPDFARNVLACANDGGLMRLAAASLLHLLGTLAHPADCR